MSSGQREIKKMKKKVLVTLLVIALALVSVSAKDLGIKVGGELGWGFESLIFKVSDGNEEWKGEKVKNNGFSVNLTGEYDFNKNWGVKASFGMMFAGKASASVGNYATGWNDWFSLKEKSGLFIDFAVDAKYTYSINKNISVSGLAGIELLSGYLAKTGDEETDEKNNNFALGINAGVEGSYLIADNISLNAGANFSWMFVNNCETFDSIRDDASEDGSKCSIHGFYIRPYVGATYAF